MFLAFWGFLFHSFETGLLRSCFNLHQSRRPREYSYPSHSQHLILIQIFVQNYILAVPLAELQQCFCQLHSFPWVGLLWKFFGSQLRQGNLRGRIDREAVGRGSSLCKAILPIQNDAHGTHCITTSFQETLVGSSTQLMSPYLQKQVCWEDTGAWTESTLPREPTPVDGEILS